ncbi:replication initiation protein [Spirosoma sordidisoli]|uniref:RepB family plasmid replication initiator protein n=1 Tax=Spirosoma sordidisoli TaxID=2502893 RepID=A0A4Q2UFS6_9BACT|nr:replication initiation protein [Spirosoma sordidisoli]RYC66211.1 RepB family plasmid replication initiator protein [Spirosoma sordidisoli]
MESAIQVRQHNAITNARYEYSEMQLDIFLYLLSSLRKDQPDGVYEISVGEMSKLTGKKYNYQQLRLATEGMGSRMFEIPNETDKKGRQVWRQMWMFDRVDYVHGTGIIEIEFTRTIQPYLFDLKANFTSFQLYSALRLGSKHAKRIYTLCSQWKDKGQTPEYVIEEFKRTIGLINDKGDMEYAEITMFKKFVLDIAVKQINEHTDLEIGYTLRKRGRSFQNITFTVKAQPLAVVLPVKDGPAKAGVALAGVSDAQYQNARLLLEKWNIKRADVVNQIMNSAGLVQEVNKFAYELQTGKIKVEKNVAGYLLTRLGLKEPKRKQDNA